MYTPALATGRAMSKGDKRTASLATGCKHKQLVFKEQLHTKVQGGRVPGETQDKTVCEGGVLGSRW